MLTPITGPTKPAIYTLIDAFCEFIPDADFSFGHLALSDYNLSNDNIHFCLDYRRQWLIDQYEDIKHQTIDSHDFSDKLDKLLEKSSIISSFLLFLLEIPEEMREVDDE